MAVNPTAGESQLTPLTETELTQLYGERHASLVPFEQLAGQFRNGHEWTWPLVWLVLGALVLESLSGAWQSRRGGRRQAGGAA